MLPLTALADAAREQALRLLQPGAAAVAETGTRALAWALKDLCYEAWSTEPSRAAHAADALRMICEAGVPGDEADEVSALADWTAGIAEVTRGQMAEALGCFDRAAATFRRIGLTDAAAQTQVPKIMALSMLGQHAQAAECAEVTQRELLALGNVAAASRVSLNLGALHMLRDAYPQAALHYREATVLFARIGDQEHSVMSDIGLAAALTSMGDFDEALLIYSRARMRAGGRGFEMLLAMVDESVALVDLARGHYREALAGLEAARRRYETLAVPQALAISEKQLADTYLELRLLPEALALFETVMAQLQALDLPDELAWVLAQRGRALALQGRHAAADESFASAATLFAAQGNAVGGSAISLARAELALAEGDIEVAGLAAEQAIKGFAEAEQADGRACAEVVRAHVLLRCGRVAEAKAAFDATLEAARRRQQLQVQVRCLTGQGLVAQAVGDAEAAGQAFEAAIELFEHQRRALPGDEMRRAFLTDHLRPYQERLRMALAGTSAAEVLLQLDRCRARALDERLAEDAPGAVDSEAQALRDRLNWLYRRVQRLHDEHGLSAMLNQELLRTEAELLERARRQRLAAAPAAGSIRSGLNLVALQQALQEGDALVEYGVQDDELFACIVTNREVRVRRALSQWPQVVDAVRSALFQIETLRHGTAPVQRHLAILAERTQARLAVLYRLVWAPLAQDLSACRRVMVIPHAQLGALPFAALADGGPCLGQRHELAIALSARIALRGLLRQPQPARRALALGESSRLPHTAAEAVYVASLFPDGKAFVGDQATLQVLRSQAPLADIVHLACHGQFRSDNPRFSALHLHDGALTVDDAESLALKPCTVVLSACETGLAEVSTGNEMVGMVRAFLVAGAARVLATLWPVDDAVTAEFMGHFYAALVQGLAPAAALRKAQDEVRKTHAHPYFWCAFTLYGGW